MPVVSGRPKILVRWEKFEADIYVMGQRRGNGERWRLLAKVGRLGFAVHFVSPLTLVGDFLDVGHPHPIAGF